MLLPVRPMHRPPGTDHDDITPQVLQVQPGLWRPAAAAEATKLILGSKLIRATPPPGPPIKVGSGEVVHIGDYTLAADYDAPAVVVRQHGRDDVAAQRALAA